MEADVEDMEKWWGTRVEEVVGMERRKKDGSDGQSSVSRARRMEDDKD